MAKQVRIPVPGGIVGHSKTYSEVVLQEPSYGTYLDLGDLTTQCRVPDGSIMWVDNNETIREYITRCLVEPKDPLLLEQGGLKLAMAVKAAVIGFFLPDRTAAEPSPTSPETSSSSSKPDASPPTL